MNILRYVLIALYLFAAVCNSIAVITMPDIKKRMVCLSSALTTILTAYFLYAI